MTSSATKPLFARLARIQFERLADVAIKGRTEPVAVYRPVESKRSSLAASGAWSAVGRSGTFLPNGCEAWWPARKRQSLFSKARPASASRGCVADLLRDGPGLRGNLPAGRG